MATDGFPQRLMIVLFRKLIDKGRQEISQIIDNLSDIRNSARVRIGSTAGIGRGTKVINLFLKLKNVHAITSFLRPNHTTERRKGQPQRKEYAMKINQTETMLDIENKPEAAAIMEFLGRLTQAEKKDMLLFFQGANLAQSLAANTKAGV